MPINRAERLYSRCCGMCVLRRCDSRKVVQSYLEDARQAGVSVSDAADFVLTPNCVGGGGVVSNSAMGTILRAYGTGKWKVAEMDKYVKEVKPHLKE